MSKKSECQVTKVTIKIGDKDHSVTIDQAKALKEALEEFFGKAIVREEHHHHHDYYRWSRPWVDIRPRYEKYTISMGASGETAMLAVK